MSRGFLSSTSELQSERTIARLAGRLADATLDRMETWTADDDDPWGVCAAKLDAAEFVVLLLGAEPGSPLVDTGLSYTQAEYEMAQSLGLPIFVFAAKDVRERALTSETSDAARLVDFIDEVLEARTAVLYSTPDELADRVEETLRDRDAHPFRTPLATSEAWRKAAAGVADDLAAAVELQVYLVEFRSAGARSTPRHSPSTALAKLRLVRREAADAGIEAKLLTEIVEFGEPEAVYRARIAEVQASRNVVVGIGGSADISWIALLQGGPGNVGVWYPAGIAMPSLDDTIDLMAYTRRQLESCDVALEMAGYIRKAARPAIIAALDVV